MKLLFLTPHLPYPPRQGAALRNFNIIKNLAQRHTVDLLTFLAPGELLTPENPLHQLCGRIATVAQPRRFLRQRAWETLASPLPDMALRLEAQTMHALVAQWVNDVAYDLVQIEGIEMAPYVHAATGDKRQGDKVTRLTPSPCHPFTLSPYPLPPALVFDNHNCEYLLQKRNALADLHQPKRWLAAAYSIMQWQKLRKYEARICRYANATVAVSEADKTALQALAPDAPITVVPNGIDPEEYEAAPSAPGNDAGVFRLVFTGKMDYRPNIDAALWFGQKVLPRIQAEEPNVCFQIVGANPHPRLDILRTNPAVDITGSVPDSRPYISNAHVYVIPMRVGGGTRFKALEAMACQQAIISTSLGVEGIPVQHQREVILADTPDDFAVAVLHLLKNWRSGGDLVRCLGARGRNFVTTTYSWAQIIPQLEKVYASVLAQQSQKRDSMSTLDAH
jgi:glycosyltransferase involved in cell wall biosynthesis